MPETKPPERYRIYIDESGDHVFYEEETLSEPKHRYLALVGVIFSMREYLAFHEALEGLKQKHFPHNPDDPVVLHRKEIINRNGPFWRLRNEDVRTAFDRDLIGFLQVTDFSAIGIVIDKLELRRRYPDPFHPYHLALGIILQNYCGYLNHINRCGDVMAESRGGREDALLRDAYKHIHEQGDMDHGAEFFKRALTSKTPKFKRKEANIAGLQLADILAYPVKQQILMENGRVKGAGATFGGQLVHAIEARLARHPHTREVEGYGKVLFPK